MGYFLFIPYGFKLFIGALDGTCILYKLGGGRGGVVFEGKACPGIDSGLAKQLKVRKLNSMSSVYQIKLYQFQFSA